MNGSTISERVRDQSSTCAPSLHLPQRRLKSISFIAAVVAAAGILATGSTTTGEVSAEGLLTWPGFLRLAHSHNDYERERPLQDAVEARVTSIEIDLFLEGDLLLVGHDRGQWRGEFEALYLRPLNELWQKGSLPVSADATFLLWLDLKEDSAALRRELHRLLEAYPVTNGAVCARPRVEVILTGDKLSKEAFIVEHPCGRVSRDSNSFSEGDPPGTPHWIWYALDWETIGAWDGQGAMPIEERERLRELVRQVRAKGRTVRLWNHPATLAFWEEAAGAGVDRLGTDALPAGEARLCRIAKRRF